MEGFGLVFEGIQRFTVGLAEKVLIADYCGQIIRRLADLGSDTMLVGAWLSAIMFTLKKRNLMDDFGGTKTVKFKIGSRSITDFWKGIFAKASDIFDLNKEGQKIIDFLVGGKQ